MLDSIMAALKARTDLQAWSIKHIIECDTQLYAVPNSVEANRTVSSERYVIDVLCDTTGAGGEPACGTASVTVMPEDNLTHAIDEVVLMASLVRNPPYTFLGPSAYPEVALADAELLTDAVGTLDRLHRRLRQAVKQRPAIQLTSAELYGTITTLHLVNSRGIDVQQVSTHLALEWVLIARSGEQEREMFVELKRRRAADVDIEDEVRRRADWAIDLLTAQAAPQYVGPVVLRDSALANFMGGETVFRGRNLFATLGTAEARYGELSHWEIGKSIFRTEATGDPLTLWASRQLPYGIHSNRFDEEGVPAQRVLLIEDNRLANLVTSRRYGTYLSLPVTGEFGNIEVPPGQTAEASLLAEPYVEVATFSWFNPDPITGEFATEIRLGYLVNGNQRNPFRGGLLIGNLLDALAAVHWSRETGFYGFYQGPRTARFLSLTVAGE